MSNNLKCASIILIALLIIVLLAAFYLKNTGVTQFPKEPPSENIVRCPADVKKCPNGSYVGRVAPSCSFAPCPEERKY